jgi:hypothetical protein
MKMIDLRNIFLSKLDLNLSDSKKKQFTIHLNHVMTLLAKDLDMPVSGLFLLKDGQELHNSVIKYIKNYFDV